MLTCFKMWGYDNCIGIDISKSCVDFVKSLGLNCELVEDTQEWLRKHPNTFDLITLLDVLEHIPRENVISFLKDIYNALKPGGILIIQVPNLGAPDSNLHMYNDITHYVGYTEHSLQQVLITAGFKKIHFQPFEEIVDKNLKAVLHKFIRYIYWKMVRFVRKVNCNLNPSILTPVFSAIVYKEIEE